MNSTTPGEHAPRVVVLGGESPSTAAAIEGVVEGGADLRAVFVRTPVPSRHGTGGEIAVETGSRIGAAAKRSPAVIERLEDADAPEAIEHVASHAPDVVLLACYPRRVGPALRAAARVACLNIHPSPLPAYRGPAPTFWQMRAGERETGVTVHLVADRIDAGSIVAAQAMPMAAGARADDVESTLFRIGGRIAVEASARLLAGESLARAQDERAASWFPVPSRRDLRVPVAWGVERAYRFIEGVRAPGLVFAIATRGGIVHAERATAFEIGATPDAEVARAGGVTRVRFADGALTVVEARDAMD